MSHIYAREYCGQPVPDALRRFSGECCVLTKGHKSEHRSLGIGNRETGTGPKIWPNADPTQIMVKDVRRIVRKAGLAAPHREASRNWSWITRDGAAVDRWGNQIVRVLWQAGEHGPRLPTKNPAWGAAIVALTLAGYRVIHDPGHLLVSRRVLRKTAFGYE